MTAYPVLLQLEGRPVVIVGGGQVASRKARDLLNSGAIITVISPELSPTLTTLVLHGEIHWRQELYAPGMLAELQPLLVFAATDSAVVNRTAAAEAESLGILVNILDASAAGSFSNMAVVRRGDVTIGIATGGTSPTLAAHLRQEIESVIGEEYRTLAHWLAAVRPTVQGAIPRQEERRALWHTLLVSSILEHLRRGDEETAYAVLNRILVEHGVIRRDVARHAPAFAQSIAD